MVNAEQLSFGDDFLAPPRWEEPWYVERVGVETAVPWFARYHYLGNVPVQAWCWGVRGRPSGDMVACVAIGQPVANIYGMTAKFGLEAWLGNWEIVRVAVHPDAPTNTASRSIAMVLDDLAVAKHLDWVFSYADTGEGHHGGIYQALGAVYLGLSSVADTYLLDGHIKVPSRTKNVRYGTKVKVEELQAVGIDIQRVGGTAKHIYVLPIGNKAVRRAIRRHLQQYELPYPKREDDEPW